MNLKINFDAPIDFAPENFKSLVRICGLYFIFLEKRIISYPHGGSRLIYIGMSEKPSNSISKRLGNHYDGKSGNFGLKNYQKTDKVMFTYINFDAIRSFWSKSIEDIESFFILDFVSKFGVYPICNNKTGFPDISGDLKNIFEINWKYFN